MEQKKKKEKRKRGWIINYVSTVSSSPLQYNMECIYADKVKYFIAVLP
jgi:hypothetical protein